MSALPFEVRARIYELGQQANPRLSNREIAKLTGYSDDTAWKYRDIKPEAKVIEEGFEAPPLKKLEDYCSKNTPSIPASSAVTRVTAIGDLHDDPHLEKSRFTWIGRHIAATQPDRVVQIGDIADFESLSFHSGNETANARFKPRFVADIASLEKACDLMVEPIQKAGLYIPFDVTLGNHENRIWRFEDACPETVGLLQRDFAKVLNDRGMNFYQYGQYIDVAGVKFVHCPFSVMGKPIGGVTASQTIARQASSDLCFGHTHKKSVITLPRLGGEDKVTVIDLGCALPEGYVENYAKHCMNGWSWGIWELLIQHGSIQGFNFIPMAELERRHGK